MIAVCEEQPVEFSPFQLPGVIKTAWVTQKCRVAEVAWASSSYLEQGRCFCSLPSLDLVPNRHLQKMDWISVGDLEYTLALVAVLWL